MSTGKYLWQNNLVFRIIDLLPPLYWQGKGVSAIETLTSFIVSVMASVAAYYICKWLDGDG